MSQRSDKASDRCIVRRLEVGDLRELVDLCREHAAYERATWLEHDREPGLRALFFDPGGAHCWVVEAPGELAGFASANMELSTWDARRYLHLDCLYLRPAYRERGLGRALFLQVARTALEQGAVTVQWQTPAWNEDAVRFYRRLGATSQDKLRFTLDPEECASILGTPSRNEPPLSDSEPRPR